MWWGATFAIRGQMRISDIESLNVFYDEAGRIVRLEQRASRVAPVLFLALLVPATLALLIPCLMLAVSAAAEPSTRAALADNPRALAGTAVGLVAWAMLWGIPASRFF